MRNEGKALGGFGETGISFFSILLLWSGTAISQRIKLILPERQRQGRATTTKLSHPRTLAHHWAC
jgi:hypothetical protein